MLLIKNPQRTFITYFLVFFCLGVVYHIKIIIPNEELIKSFLGNSLNGRMSFNFFTIFPFFFICLITILSTIVYFGKIKKIHFTENKIEIKTRFLNEICKNKINELIIVENENNQIIRIVLKCIKNTFVIQSPDNFHISKIKNYLKLEKEDSTIPYTYHEKGMPGKRMTEKRRVYELNKKLPLTRVLRQAG